MALDIVTLGCCASLMEALLAAALVFVRSRQKTCDGFTEWTASVLSLMARGRIPLRHAFRDGT